MRTGSRSLLGILALWIAAPGPAAAQAGPSAWVGDPPIIETVSQIMARDQASLAPPAAPRPSHPRLRLSPVGKAPAAAQSLGPLRGSQPLFSGPFSPQSVGTKFLAVQSSESAFIPPDTMGAVGPSQILVCVNGRIKLFDRTGTLDQTVLNVTTDAFFNSVRNGSSASDCRVRFDPDSQRWFVTMINTPSTNNRVMIAVSAGSTITPASQFSFFQFQQNLVAPAGDNNLFADYPTLGIDKNALYMGVNLFTGAGAFKGSSGFVIQKSSVLGAGPILATALRGLATSTGAGAFTPQGVDNDDPAAVKGYFVGVDTSGAVSALTLVRVQNPGSASPAPSVDATLTVNVPAYGPALGGISAMGSTTPLDDVDNRLMMAQMKTGNLWTVHAIQVDATGAASPSGGRDGARWYEVTGLDGATPSLVQSGTLFDPSASSPSSYFVPSIAASGQGHVALGATVAGPAEHAEIALSGRLSGDAPRTLRAPTVAQTSSTSYNADPKDPVQRWGDFSFTCVDPNDNMTLWSFQEYCNLTDSWGVRVFQLRAPLPATPAALSSTQVSVGQPSVHVTLTGISTSGSGFYDPGPGYPQRLAVAATGGATVTGVTYVDPTTITFTLSTVGASLGPQDITVTNPDGQALTGTALFTVTSGAGAPACTVTPPGAATDASPIVFSISFSEDVSGFSASGVSLTNATAGTLTATSGSTYTLAVIPVGNGPVTCQVNAGAAQAQGDNQNNLASNVASVLFDTVPPTEPGTPAASPDPNAGNFSVGWTAASDPGGSGIASYTLLRSANGGAFTAIATGVSGLSVPQSGLVQGSYEYQVLAIDQAGNVGPASGPSAPVIVDTTPPGAPGVPSGAPNPNSSGTFTVTWTAATDAGGSGVAGYTVLRSVNGAAFANLASGIAGLSVAQSGLVQGSYRYQVFAVDGAGNVGPAGPVSAPVVVDSTAPGAPGTPSGSPSPNQTGSFTVAWAAATDAGGSGVASYTVQRSANGGAFATVASGQGGLALPQTGLPQGSYVYQVQAVDGAGNVGPWSASSLPVIVDTTPPSAPGSPVGTPNPSTGTFTLSWTAATDAGGSGVGSYTIQRSVNGSAMAAVATGQAGLSLAQTGLAQGAYRYQVQAVDGAGNVGPWSAVSPAVMVLSTPPRTTILAGPPNPSSSAGASFLFSSSVADCSFQTKLDGAAGWTSNGTATLMSYSGLANGTHTFQVRAVDAAGNVDPAPPSSTWTISTTAGVTHAPQTILTGQPSSPTARTSATFSFASTEPGGTFQVQLDGGGWISNGSSGTKTYSGLSLGTHLFEVRAVDAASNVDPNPPGVTWTIVAAPSDGTAPLLESFSDGVALTNWTVSSTDALVTWAVDGTPASMPGLPYVSPPSSLNYNNGTNYDTPGLPNSGTATSPSISISGVPAARLKFFCNYETETPGTDHDVRFVQISNDNFATLLVNEQLSTAPGSALAGACAAMGTWHEHVVRLAGMTGPIQVRFLFDTLDAGLNGFPGWFVDDFEISDLFVSGLNQSGGSGGAPLPVGGTIASPAVTVAGVVSADATGPVTLEVEVEPVGTAFSGTPTGTVTGSGPGTPLLVTLTLPGNGTYHWQARTVSGAATSSWMSFGLNAESDPDFIVQVSTSAAPGAGGGSHGGCGLLGAEAAGVLALGAILRRRRPWARGSRSARAVRLPRRQE